MNGGAEALNTGIHRLKIELRPYVRASQYNTQVRQVSRSYGFEGEWLSLSGSTEPVANTYDAMYPIKTLTDGKSYTTTYAYNNIGLVSSSLTPPLH